MHTEKTIIEILPDGHTTPIVVSKEAWDCAFILTRAYLERQIEGMKVPTINALRHAFKLGLRDSKLLYEEAEAYAWAKHQENQQFEKEQHEFYNPPYEPDASEPF